MVAYLYIPLQLYDSKLAHFDKEFNIKCNGDDMYFTMGDFSIPYIHSKKNWDFLAKFTTITGPKGRVVRETVRTYGPLHILNLCFVGDFQGPISVTVPITKIAGNSVLVPNMMDAIRSKFTLYQDELHHFIVPHQIS